MPVDDTETLSIAQLQLEALFLGLRTDTGIDLKRYKTKYGVDLLADKRKIIDELIKNKLVELKDCFLRPTRAGMAVADRLVRQQICGTEQHYLKPHLDCSSPSHRIGYSASGRG